MQAANVVGLVRDVLGTDVVGAYLHGSAVLGGLRQCSDVDVFVVVRRGTTLQQRRALVAGLLELSGERARRGPARPVELTIVVQSPTTSPDHRPVLAHARTIYLGDEEECWGDLFPHVRPHADHVVGAIEWLAGYGGRGSKSTPDA